MACEKVSQAVNEAAASQNQVEALDAVLANMKNLSTPATITTDLKFIADTILELPINVVQTRLLLDKFLDTLKVFEDGDLWVEVGEHLLAAIRSNDATSSTLLGHLSSTRELIASGHEANESFVEAAKVLSEISLDSSQRIVQNIDKAKIWIRIVRNYLEVDDSTSAEIYLNKLKNIMHTFRSDELMLHFNLSTARIQDAKREFLSAAQSYHSVSTFPGIDEDESIHTLGMAIKCAILAPAGPSRRKALGRLYLDERSASLEEFGIMEKMYLDRLLTSDEVDRFAAGLQPHQLAITADGSTVLEKAVVDHNLLGVSRLFHNISFDELGQRLNLSADKAESATAKMIEQGRLVGRIDQIDRVIWFEGGEASGEKGSGHAEVPLFKDTRRWDSNVQALAEELELLTNAIQSEFPVRFLTPLSRTASLPFLAKREE